MKFPTRTFSFPLKKYPRLKQVEPNLPSSSKRRLRSSLTISKLPSCYLRTTIFRTLRSARFWDARQKLSKRDFIVSGSSLRKGWPRSFSLKVEANRTSSVTPWTSCDDSFCFWIRAWLNRSRWFHSMNDERKTACMEDTVGTEWLKVVKIKSVS